MFVFGSCPLPCGRHISFLNLMMKKVIVSRDVVWLGKCYGDWRGITSNVINEAPTDTVDPYYTDDLIDDQEYPSSDQGRVMEPDGRMKIMVIILLLSQIMKIQKMRRILGVGVILMEENATATAGTKHIDARYHFVR
jgi:hypothetical protein